YALFTCILPFMTPPPPPSTLFPYTTLFRSPRGVRTKVTESPRPTCGVCRQKADATFHGILRILWQSCCWTRCGKSCISLLPANRSEEHTSELQSRSDLVCRLLLEKKKKIKK